MLAKRIIACLDVADGRVVKGIHFVDIRDAGDPVELAKRYSHEGADEIVFLDISATVEGRGTLLDIVERTAREVFVPLTVGGGVRSVEDARRLLSVGADKVGVNSAAVARPELISELSEAFGAQAVVLAIDARLDHLGVRGLDRALPGEMHRQAGALESSVKSAHSQSGWRVFVAGGRTPTELDAVEWAKRGQALGAGEILLTSMETDGVKGGFDHALTRTVREELTIPVIASGGAGSAADFVRLFQETDADAGLAASIFHFKETSIKEIKQALHAGGIPVRIGHIGLISPISPIQEVQQ